MEIELTRDELRSTIMYMSSDEIIEFFEQHGLELMKELEPITTGIYRREPGTDMVRFDGYGSWNYVDQYGENNSGDSFPITWACFDEAVGDWWVLVLDKDNNPVFNGQRVLMNYDGKRVA